MSNKKDKQSSGNGDSRKLFLFLEELAWLLSSYSDLNIESAVKEMRSKTGHDVNASSVANAYVSSNPNKHFLVGTLPRILVDEALFPTNEHIAQFANSVLRVDIPRFHKKSKYELIGHIVCETNNLDDSALSKLVKALGIIIDGGEKIRKLVSQRQIQDFGWNAIIQEILTGKRDE